MNITIKKAPLSSVGNGELRIGTSLDADFWAFSPDEGDVQPSISLHPRRRRLFSRIVSDMFRNRGQLSAVVEV